MMAEVRSSSAEPDDAGSRRHGAHAPRFAAKRRRGGSVRTEET